MKVCPNEPRSPAAGRWTVCLCAGLGLIALALPGNAWLHQIKGHLGEGRLSFRAAERTGPQPAVRGGGGPSAQASDRTPSPRAATPTAEAGFRSNGKPFSPQMPAAAVVSASELPDDFVARDLSTVFPVPDSGSNTLSRSEDAVGALDEIEQNYQLALASMGTRLGAGSRRPAVNPFQQALDGADAAPPSPSPGGEAPSGGTTASEPGAGQPQNPTAPVDQPLPEVPPDGRGAEEPLALSYLVAGAFGDSRIQRAGLTKDGTFVLEDQSRLQLFGGATFGFARPSLLFGPRDQMVSADINGDGHLDVVRTREQFLGSAVEVLTRTGNTFEFSAGGVFRFDSVIALAIFDWDGDAIPELAVVTEARPNLHFYEIVAGELRYEREVTLGAKPAAIFDTTLPSGERRLYLLPADLRPAGARYLSSENGNLQTQWFPRGLDRFQLEGAGAPEIMTLRDANRLVLLSRAGNRVRLIGSLDVVSGTPLGIIGPHSTRDRWQLMYLP